METSENKACLRSVKIVHIIKETPLNNVYKTNKTRENKDLQIGNQKLPNLVTIEHKSQSWILKSY